MLACPHPDAGPPGSQHTPGPAEDHVSWHLASFLTLSLMALLFFALGSEPPIPPRQATFFYVTSLYPFDFILLSPFFLYCSCTSLFNYLSLINIPLRSSWSFNRFHICFHICPCIRLSSPPSLYLCVIFFWMTTPLLFSNYYKIY